LQDLRFWNGVQDLRFWLGMVLVFGVAHRIPCVTSDGADGDVFPAGCFALVGFASDDIAITPGGGFEHRDAVSALCTARSGVPKRTQTDLHIHALFTFTPSSLPPTIFRVLRAQECEVNRAVPGTWNPRRTSVAVHISELWHVLTSHKKSTRPWFVAHPRFVDLEGFLRVPANPLAREVAPIRVRCFLVT
jgi:hypothetical protein